MHENTGSSHNFYRTNAKCESITKPPYLSGIVTYEDDQTAIFQRNFARIHFRFFEKKTFILTLNFQNDVAPTEVKCDFFNSSFFRCCGFSLVQ
jgi:hypothetical protein